MGFRTVFSATFSFILISAIWTSGSLVSPGLADDTPAKQLFGHVPGPANMNPASYGFYSKGCLAGGQQLVADGPFHQAMRPQRNRAWGHPNMIALIHRLAETANRDAGWPGILVGDISQARGGPMLTGHASHQMGLDADIWMMPAPPRRYTVAERNSISAVSMLSASDKFRVDPTLFTPGHVTVLRAAAKEREVARMFVHPAIKRALCEAAGNDRDWLRKIRPWYGHHYHFHIRLRCPRGQSGCRNQDPPPPGDGCGASLDWWFTDEPYKPREGPAPPPKPPVRLADLPQACTGVLNAQ